jgi:hypothetical protein
MDLERDVYTKEDMESKQKGWKGRGKRIGDLVLRLERGGSLTKMYFTQHQIFVLQFSLLLRERLRPAGPTEVMSLRYALRQWYHTFLRDVHLLKRNVPCRSDTWCTLGIPANPFVSGTDGQVDPPV